MASPSLFPAVFVIFGITGDLANRKILPALIGLYAKNLLPEQYAILGFSRKIGSDEEMRAYLRAHLLIRADAYTEEVVTGFLNRISCVQGDYADPAAYAALALKIKECEAFFGTHTKVLFHLSVPPSSYQNIVIGLGNAKLATRASRILIEKPFGRDTDSARALHKQLKKFFAEEQIFRVDHYLAKTGLERVMIFRFVQGTLETLWNRKHIEKVHIRRLEKDDVSVRAGFYDSVGALRDVVQNHLLEMFAVLTMEKPKKWDAKYITRARAKALARLAPIKTKNLPRQVVRGQYERYTAEQGVAPESKTETYVRVEAFINSRRFKGVPFYLETGKALAASCTTIEVYFTDSAKKELERAGERQDKITFDLQGNPAAVILGDYERMFSKALVGDQTTFASFEEILASWKFITPILESWDSLPLQAYPKGAHEVAS